MMLESRVRAALCLLVLIGTLADVSHAKNGVTCSWGVCNKDCGTGQRTCNRSNGKVWNIDCHVQSCEPFEGCGSADIVFVFDSSASIGDRNWWVTKQFSIDVVKGLVVGKDKSRVGSVTYSKDATTHFDLDVFFGINELEDPLWQLEWLKDVTNTYDGLLHAQHVIERSSRADKKHIVVLVTDGVSNVKKSRTVPQAQSMHEAGIEIFVIGIGDVDKAEIDGIASEPKDTHCYSVPNYNALVAITGTVVNETCESANMTECGEFSEYTDCILDDQVNLCGSGVISRTRECRFYSAKDGPYIARNHTENTPCNGDPCPPTEPPSAPNCTWTECSVSCGGGERTCDRGNGKFWTIPCHVQDCDAVVDCGEADLTFLLDSSASIGERNWWRVKQFAIDVTKGLSVGEDMINVAAVSFSRDGFVQWKLTDDTSKDPAGVESSLWDLDWLMLTTHTAEGLRLARDTALNTKRIGVKSIVIVMTDGESNIKSDLTIATAKTLHDAGLEVFCIVVRDTGSAEFDAIASEPATTYLHHLYDYDALTGITQAIDGQICLAVRGLL